jgi:sugar transferase (PEP-CTERM/EpsH1 system associated)
MKILYVCHRVPYPPTRGGKIRSFNMIRHFSEQGHEVTVASIARSTVELSEASGLSSYCKQVIVEVVSDTAAALRMLVRGISLQPSSFGYFWSPRLAQRIAANINASPPDLIFVHCSSVAPYVAEYSGATKILDFGDMDSQKWREYAQHRRFPLSRVYQVEAVKLERVERHLTRKFDLATCTTRAEVASLDGLGASCPTDWFPNGVDTDFFAPAAQPYDANTVAFVGRMDYYPNQQAVQWFCREVWPALCNRFPQLRFLVVGASPPPEIQQLGRIAGVSVTGTVADVRPFVQIAALTVAPLLIARGTQNKILESMAMGTPVVCSEAAAGGVNAVANEHLLVARDTTDWVAQVTQLIANPMRRMQLAAAGRAQMLSQHSWAASMRRMDQLVEQTLRRKSL